MGFQRIGLFFWPRITYLNREPIVNLSGTIPPLIHLFIGEWEEARSLIGQGAIGMKEI